MASPTNPFGSGNSNFMVGFTSQLTQAMNGLFARQYAGQQQELQQNQGLVSALIKGGSPEVQALGLSLLQNPKALKDAGKLFQTPEYQQILAITRRAHQQAGNEVGAGAGGLGAPGAGPTGVGTGQNLGAPPPGANDSSAQGAQNASALSPGTQLASSFSPGMPNSPSPMSLLGGAGADAGSTSAVATPEPPASAAPMSAAMSTNAPASAGAAPPNLTPAAPSAAAPPPGAPASPATGVGAPPPTTGQTSKVQSFADFNTYTKGAAVSVYSQARQLEDKIASDVAQRNPLGYQAELEKAVAPVRVWEAQKFQILAHMESLGQALEAQGVPWEQAQQIMQKELAPLQAKADQALNLEKQKEAGKEHLEGTKANLKVGVAQAVEPMKIAEIDRRGALASQRQLAGFGKPFNYVDKAPNGTLTLQRFVPDPTSPNGFRMVGSQDGGHIPISSQEKSVLEGTVTAQKSLARLQGIREQIQAAGGDVSWPEAKLNAWMYSNGMDPGKLQASKQQLAGALNAQILSSLGRGSRLHAVAEQFLSHLPQRGDEGTLFWEKIDNLTPIVSDTQGSIFQITGTQPSDFGVPPPGGAAPPAAANPYR